MCAVSAVLLLCTANVCRSVMAQAMLSARLAARGVTAGVGSAGLLAGDRRPPPEVISVMAARGIDVSRHRSRVVTAEDLAAADLILGLAREHVRHAAVLLPAAWPRAFTLRELVRRGQQAGSARPGEPLGHWLDRAADGREPGRPARPRPGRRRGRPGRRPAAPPTRRPRACSTGSPATWSTWAGRAAGRCQSRPGPFGIRIFKILSSERSPVPPPSVRRLRSRGLQQPLPGNRARAAPLRWRTRPAAAAGRRPRRPARAGSARPGRAA